MEIFNIKEKPEYLKEILILETKEWGRPYQSEEELNDRINKKIEKAKSLWDLNNYCKLMLLEDNELIGFISLFPTDGDEHQELTPWYATMYVKKEYRGKGYSKVLNDAILKEAKNRGYDKIYLKSDLVNYYEKFGAIYINKLNNGEKLYYIDLKETNK